MKSINLNKLVLKKLSPKKEKSNINDEFKKETEEVENKSKTKLYICKSDNNLIKESTYENQ